MNITRLDEGWVLRAGSLAPLVKARGFGMTPGRSEPAAVVCSD
jgi:hypothetical protein